MSKRILEQLKEYYAKQPLDSFEQAKAVAEDYKLVFDNVVNEGGLRGWEDLLELDDDIGSSFYWKLSPQGFEYWNERNGEI